MTWTRTGDDYPERLLELSDAAYRLHHAAMTLCNRLELDGRLRRAHLALVAVPPRTKRAAIVRELVDAELWDEDEDGWTLVDFLEDQPSKEEIRARRAYDSARQAVRYAKNKNKTAQERADLKSAEARARDAYYAVRERRRASLSQSESQGESQRPDPTRPVPTEDEAEAGAAAAVNGAAGSPGPTPLRAPRLPQAAAELAEYIKRSESIA